jgi:hypothetical protein
MVIQMGAQGWQSNALDEGYTLVQMDSSFAHDLINQKNVNREDVAWPIQYLRGM